MASKSFCSKILLFGEYSIIHGGMGLAIPYNLFDGKLSFSKKDGQIDRELQAFSRYIGDMKASNELDFSFDTDSFSFDVSQGLKFISTIPQGYGVGSSGALVAAVYDTYGPSETERPKNKKDIIKQLIKLESHFHGASSGLDPLISYLNSSLLISKDRELSEVNLPPFSGKKGSMFLLNTGRARRTEPLVNLFLEKCNSKSFLSLINEDLVSITQDCINSFLEGRIDLLFDSFIDLSRFQYEHFSPMIPKLYRQLWEEGLESEDFSLKLCGAGGGGFLLGMTKDLEKARPSLSQHQIRPIFQF